MDAKRWTLLLAMIGTLLVTAFAKDGNTEDRQAQKACFREHIKPEVDAQRVKLEKSLSAEDRQAIATLCRHHCCLSMKRCTSCWGYGMEMPSLSNAFLMCSVSSK